MNASGTGNLTALQGTGIEVRGTIGKERGLIGISLDGQTTSFDRTSDTVECEFPLFQKYGLPRGQHTVIITLLARNQTLDNNGTMVGLLSLQHLRLVLCAIWEVIN